MAKEEAKDVKPNNVPDPYKTEVCKDGMDFYVSKSPMTHGYDKETEPKKAPPGTVTP